MQLIVELRSNLVPGVEVDRATTEIYAASGRSPVQTSIDELGWGDPLERAVRLAEAPGLTPGEYLVIVDLARGSSPIASRTIAVSVTATTTLTVLVTRDCRSVMCAPGSTCVAGMCVPTECSEERSSACPEVMCERDDECTSSVACADARCVEGACQRFGVHERCSENEYCDPDEGCLPRPGMEIDAGPGCTADGCDDGEPCTDDACGASGCEHTPNAMPCDDGSFCNGPDQCGSGSCSIHPGDPCPGMSTCDEASDTCQGCASADDCPAETAGAWGACVFAGDCAASGTRTRTVTSYTCSGGMCQPLPRTESEACTRPSREDMVCGTTTCGGWGGCGYTSTCDESATETRGCTERLCRSGACANVATTESRGCARNTDGIDCGSGCDAWGSCGWASECAESATRSRTCYTRTCGGGSCQSAPRTENDPCTRSTEGNVCGSNPNYCGRSTDCHICRSGSCAVNAPHWDAACLPSCGQAGNLCGSAALCCPADSTGCPRVGNTWDCAVCCASSFCY